MIISGRVLAKGLIAMALVLSSVLPGEAEAATQLGQVSPGDPPSSCAAGNLLQAATSATTNPYEIPSPGGVITRWSHRGNDTDGGSGRLQVWRAASPSNFTLVGRSALQDFTSGVVESFPTRIRVSTEDALGLRSGVNTGCLHGGVLGDRVFQGFPSSDPAPGEARNFPVIDNTFLLNVSAILEPDADRDGFGDETQDRCPGQPGPSDGCPLGSSTSPSLTLELEAKRKQKPNKLKLDVACGEVDCSVELAGKAKVPKASGAAVTAAKAKKFKLKRKEAEVSAGATETVRLKFKRNRKSVKKIKRLLKQDGKKTRKRAKAVAKATATGAGGTDSAKQKVELKR